MPDALIALAAALLLTLAASLLRVARGPTVADRIMGAQLAGTSGIGAIALIAAATQVWTILDVALVLALLAAMAVVGFAKAASKNGSGDIEQEERP